MSLDLFSLVIFSQNSGYLPVPSAIYTIFISIFYLFLLFVMKFICYIKFETAFNTTISVCNSVLSSCNNFRWVKSPPQMKQGRYL